MLRKKRVKLNGKSPQEFELNTLSQKHLDFYKEEVRVLEKKSETPDEVNLIFESSKSQQKRKKSWKILKIKKN
jgi:hypothetical protein